MDGFEAGLDAPEVSDQIRDIVAHQGDNPLYHVREVAKLDHEYQLNEYLALHWTLIETGIRGSGDPRERNETPYYVVGWRHPGPSAKPEPKSGW